MVSFTLLDNHHRGKKKIVTQVIFTKPTVLYKYEYPTYYLKAIQSVHTKKIIYPGLYVYVGRYDITTRLYYNLNILKILPAVVVCTDRAYMYIIRCSKAS